MSLETLNLLEHVTGQDHPQPGAREELHVSRDPRVVASKDRSEGGIRKGPSLKRPRTKAFNSSNLEGL